MLRQGQCRAGLTGEGGGACLANAPSAGSTARRPAKWVGLQSMMLLQCAPASSVVLGAPSTLVSYCCTIGFPFPFFLARCTVSTGVLQVVATGVLHSTWSSIIAVHPMCTSTKPRLHDSLISFIHALASCERPVCDQGGVHALFVPTLLHMRGSAQPVSGISDHHRWLQATPYFELPYSCSP